MSASVGRKRQSIPAECQVVPAVSWCRSSRTAFTPSFRKWYNVDVPMEPPPMITTSACEGRSCELAEECHFVAEALDNLEAKVRPARGRRRWREAMSWDREEPAYVSVQLP
mmetsp:Transcript_7460/g.15525  ORF Transcript_7460/g.15525 Transcript_7460/m.15525 type:complete len:111 (-) Transcript_7460:1-333(-)